MWRPAKAFPKHDRLLENLNYDRDMLYFLTQTIGMICAILEQHTPKKRELFSTHQQMLERDKVISS